MTPPRQICPAPRASAACENCRVRKVRCLPSRKEGTCQRCLASRVSCVLFVRPSTHRESNDSAADVDNKTPRDETYMDIMSSLVAPREPKPQKGAAEALEGLHLGSIARMFPTSPSQGATEGMHFVGAGQQTIQSSTHSVASPGSSRPSLSADQAEALIREFAAKSLAFPFVVLPPNSTFASLAKERPCLTLAILCGMSVFYPETQFYLNLDFKKSLSERVSVHGERSMDILQGLLVYLAFYPLRFNAASRQLYHFIQTMVSILTDLQYDLPPSKRDHNSATGDEFAERRAYLGCYYISSTTAIPPRRLNRIEYTVYLDWCASQLARSPSSTDKLVSSLIFLQRIAGPTSIDQARDGGNEGLLDASLLTINWNSSLGPIANIENCTPKDLLSCSSFKILKAFASMKLAVDASQKALVLQFPSQAFNSSIAILEGLDAIAQLLGMFVSLPEPEYQQLLMPEWSRLIGTIAVLFTFVHQLSLEQPLDSDVLDKITQLTILFETLAVRMEDMTQVGKQERAPPDVFCLFGSVLRVVREKYGQLLSRLSQSQKRNSTSKAVPLPMYCPIVNGSLKTTEYWEVLQDTFGFADGDIASQNVVFTGSFDAQTEFIE